MKRLSQITGEALLVGTLAACTATAPETEAENTAYPSSESAQTDRLQDLAASIISLYDDLPSSAFESKPPHTSGVKIPLYDGGELTLAVQTPEVEPDADQPLMLSVTQEDVPGGSFDAAFYITEEGLWNAYCTRGDGMKLSEQNQQDYQLNGEPVVENPAMAEVILRNIIMGAENAVQSTRDTFEGVAMPPLKDICAFNLGDG